MVVAEKHELLIGNFCGKNTQSTLEVQVRQKQFVSIAIGKPSVSINCDLYLTSTGACVHLRQINAVL